MIATEREYRLAEGEIARLEEALALAQNSSGEYDSLLNTSYIDSLSLQIEELQQQRRDFERLQRGEIDRLQFSTVEEFAELLVAARTARGLSQRQLGDLVGVAQQQISRWEANRFQTADLRTVAEVEAALGICVSGSVSMRDEAAGLAVERSDIGAEPASAPPR